MHCHALDAFETYMFKTAKNKKYEEIGKTGITTMKKEKQKKTNFFLVLDLKKEKTYSSYVEDGNVVKIWTQRQFEYFSRRDPKHKKKIYNLFTTWVEMKRRKKYRLF
jgi:hypothetical protein